MGNKDLNQTAKSIVDRVTGNLEDTTQNEEILSMLDKREYLLTPDECFPPKKRKRTIKR